MYSEAGFKSDEEAGSKHGLKEGGTSEETQTDEGNEKMEGEDGNKKENGLKVHSAQKAVQENEERMNEETALVQSKERKHPHFAQFEIKTH